MNVPQQVKGNSTDNISEKHFSDVAPAKDHFKIVSKRLLEVNGWQRVAGPQTARFELYNSDGHPADRSAQEGDYIKIDIPGPGSLTGDGFDWVKIIAIRQGDADDSKAPDGKSASTHIDDGESGADELNSIEQTAGEQSTEALAITVRPSDNPLTAGNETAHFFDSAATSTFIIKRIGADIQASVHGRNEKPNKEVAPTLDKLRNTVVAKGAAAGFSSMQWQSLTDGLISTAQ